MRDYLKSYLDTLGDNMRTILVYKEKQGVRIWIQSGHDIRETSISRYGNIETRYCSKWNDNPPTMAGFLLHVILGNANTGFCNTGFCNAGFCNCSMFFVSLYYYHNRAMLCICDTMQFYRMIRYIIRLYRMIRYIIQLYRMLQEWYSYTLLQFILNLLRKCDNDNFYTLLQLAIDTDTKVCFVVFMLHTWRGLLCKCNESRFFAFVKLYFCHTFVVRLQRIMGNGNCQVVFLQQGQGHFTHCYNLILAVLRGYNRDSYWALLKWL